MKSISQLYTHQGLKSIMTREALAECHVSNTRLARSSWNVYRVQKLERKEETMNWQKKKIIQQQNYGSAHPVNCCPNSCCFQAGGASAWNTLEYGFTHDQLERKPGKIKRRFLLLNLRFSVPKSPICVNLKIFIAEYSR